MTRKPTQEQKAKGFFTVGNDRGLHTRPSTEIVKKAGGFKCQITLTHLKNKANAKSLLGILMLAAPRGAKIFVEACGEDAERAVDALISLAEGNFNIHY